MVNCYLGFVLLLSLIWLTGFYIRMHYWTSNSTKFLVCIFVFFVLGYIIIPAKVRDYVFTGVGLSVCLFVCLFVTTITK